MNKHRFHHANASPLVRASRGDDKVQIQSSVHVSSSPLPLLATHKRSLNLKPQPTSSLQRHRRVQFAQQLVQVHTVDNFRDFPLWTISSEMWDAVSRDWQMASSTTDSAMVSYLYAYEMAVEQLKQSNVVDFNHEHALIQSSACNYRTLERYSQGSIRREEACRWARASIITTYTLLRWYGTDPGGVDLAAYCEPRTRESVNLASWMGRVDAAAARLEYSTLPLALRPTIQRQQQHPQPFLLETPVLYRQSPAHTRTDIAEATEQRGARVISGGIV